MRCKVLHLPTATYLYYDPTMSDPEHDHAYCYTEFEIDSGKYSVSKTELSTTFPSKKEAREYIQVWTGSRDPSGLSFQEEIVPLLLTHFEIVRVL